MMRSTLFLMTQAVMLAQAQKYLCYTGSSLYELVPLDCAAEDESSTEEWYCSTIEVCERFKENGRQCVLSRGCATKSQCTDTVTNEIYDGTTLLQPGSQLAGGMTTTLTCCKAKDYADDDVVALDYGSICNAAALSSNHLSVLYFSIASAFAMWYSFSL